MSNVDEEYGTVLASVKKWIGPSVDYDYFDSDLLMHINSYFAVMTQCGIGPSEGFYVTETSKWEDFLPNESIAQSMAKQYVQIRTRLTFDPPTSSFVAEALKKNADEMEWRMYIDQDAYKS